MSLVQPIYEVRETVNDVQIYSQSSISLKMLISMGMMYESWTNGFSSFALFLTAGKPSLLVNLNKPW